MPKPKSSLLKAARKEVQLLRKRYYKLNKEHQRLLAVTANCKCGAKEDQDKILPPAKRQRLDVIPTDPLQLPEPCAMRALRFLTPLELLKATEVSNEWKEFIESRNKLMTRAMNGTVLNIKLAHDEKLSSFSSLLDACERQYKHMKIEWDYELLRQTISNILILPVLRRTSTLETLSICIEFDICPTLFGEYFPNLVKLDLSCSNLPFKKLPRPQFFQLTTLKIRPIDVGDDTIRVATFELFLRAFPKLQHLQINTSREDGFLYDDDERWGSIPAPVVVDPTQPKLETISFPCCTYRPKFFRTHQNTLQKLMIQNMDTANLSFCLRDLKQLKCLSVIELEQNEEDEIVTYPQNSSIQTLKIEQNHLSINEFHQVLATMPSLKELAVHKCIAEYRFDIRFIASNMSKLKWLKTEQITDDDLRVYNEIKQNANQYMNTDFDLTNDADVDYYESFEELQM